MLKLELVLLVMALVLLLEAVLELELVLFVLELLCWNVIRIIITRSGIAITLLRVTCVARSLGFEHPLQ